MTNFISTLWLDNIAKSLLSDNDLLMFLTQPDKNIDSYIINTLDFKMSTALDDKIKLWKQSTYKKLSDPVDMRIVKWHKERPDNDFPHLNYSILRESLHTRFTKAKTTNTLIYHIEADISANRGRPSQYYTNLGLPHTKSGVVKGWVGWLSRVLQDRHSNEPVSLLDFIESSFVGHTLSKV